MDIFSKVKLSRIIKQKKEQGQIDNNAIDCLHSNRSANHKWISVVRDCQVRGLNATIYPAAYHA